MSERDTTSKVALMPFLRLVTEVLLGSNLLAERCFLDIVQAKAAYTGGLKHRMKRTWDIEELIEYFTLVPPELELLGNKTGATHLGFALLLIRMCAPRCNLNASSE